MGGGRTRQHTRPWACRHFSDRRFQRARTRERARTRTRIAVGEFRRRQQAQTETHKDTHVRAHPHTRAHAHARTRTHARTRAHTRTRARAHKHTNTHKHTHPHGRGRACQSSLPSPVRQSASSISCDPGPGDSDQATRIRDSERWLGLGHSDGRLGCIDSDRVTRIARAGRATFGCGARGGGGATRGRWGGGGGTRIKPRAVSYTQHRAHQT